MNNELAILLASHGDFAKSALTSAELIIGKQNNCATLGVYLEDEIHELGTRVEQEIAKLDTRNGLVILVDLIGGTPMNITVKELFKHKNALFVTGLNLPMVIELCLNRQQSLSELKHLLKHVYNEAFISKTSDEMEKGDEEDVNQIL